MNYINTRENYKSKIYYHCSPNEFEAFDLNDNKGYKEYDIPMWFFTEDIAYAKTYGNILYTVRLDIDNTFDISNPDHHQMLIDYLEENGKDSEEIEEYLQETTIRDMIYWTCEEAFYCAISNGFDSVLIQEELESEVISIAVFNVEDIIIISKKNI